MSSFWVPLIWLLIAGSLLLVELALPTFDGLMFAALGGLLVSLLTAVLPLPYWLQIALFLLISVSGTAWLYRWSKRRSPSIGLRRDSEDIAEVLEPMEAGGEGRVRWHGQSWAANSLTLDRSMNIGDRVLVMGRDGTRLQVLHWMDW
jgi:hypothetical protein|tara:strand:+ start:3291 stop:3731 length:441 start_codon:yes stop_codon:yes gene_type:complete